MKSFITLAIVMLAVVLILQTEANPLESDRMQGQGYGALVRTRRATCDLFSALGVKDSLCAAHCLAMFKGFRGGHCDDGVCICRK